MSELYQVTFYKKWSQDIETVQNVFADNADDAAMILIELDNNDDAPLGLDNLEYFAEVI